MNKTDFKDPSIKMSRLEKFCKEAVKKLAEAGFMKFPDHDVEEPWKIIHQCYLDGIEIVEFSSIGEFTDEEKRGILKEIHQRLEKRLMGNECDG